MVVRSGSVEAKVCSSKAMSLDQSGTVYFSYQRDKIGDVVVIFLVDGSGLLKNHVANEKKFVSKPGCHWYKLPTIIISKRRKHKMRNSRESWLSSISLRSPFGKKIANF